MPETSKPGYLKELVADAVAKGAAVANAAEGGGGCSSGSLITPPIVYPVTKDMRLFHEEQFGPVVPIARFSKLEEVTGAIKASWNGQQAAIFTSDAKAAAPLVDTLSTVVGRINLNVQCGRSPDNVPFSGRRSSAQGTMSISEALRAFSIETVVAYSAKHEVSGQVAVGLNTETKLFAPLA